jgi:hypothetical protein
MLLDHDTKCASGQEVRRSLSGAVQVLLESCVRLTNWWRGKPSNELQGLLAGLFSPPAADSVDSADDLGELVRDAEHENDASLASKEGAGRRQVH